MPPVCAKCEIEMRPKKNAIILETMTDDGPFEAYSADLWECPECHVEIVSGTAHKPRLAYYEDGYQEKLKEIIATEQTLKVRCWSSSTYKQQYNQNQTKDEQTQCR